MRIDRNNGLQGTNSPTPQDGKADGVGRANAAQGVGAGSEKVSELNNSLGEDTIEISASGRALLNKASEAEKAANPEAVDRAKNVLQSGMYNDQAVLERTATKLASVFSQSA